uniref:Cytochrome b561 and DOMON domain-containing protein n=2 Tax=Chenopodium quinoa TaxID=63459 RepID=A0A803MFM9_CHEQI
MFCQTVWKSNTDLVLRYVQAGPQLWSFLLSASNTNSWLGIGFSTNGQMVGSSAMVGWMYQNGTGVVKQYDLQGKEPDKVLPDAGDLTVVDNSSTVFIDANRIHLAFQINTVEPQKELLYAVGPYGQLPVDSGGLKLLEHRDMGQASLDYTTGKSQAKSSPYTGIKRTHGALNMIGWGILMPIGAIVARYFRQWDPIWFYSHIAIQIFSFLFGLVGFILGFVVKDFIKAEVTHHKNIGILILILACFQVMALLIRPKKGTKPRKYWNWYHHNAGRILVILAISNIFYGIRLGMEGSSWYGTYAVILALMVLVAIVLEIRLWRQR